MNNELMTQIEALDDREYLHEWGTAKAMGDGIPVTAIKSLAAALTLANKKLELALHCVKHYATDYFWSGADDDDPDEDFWELDGNGYDHARKILGEIARLTEGEND